MKKFVRIVVVLFEVFLLGNGILMAFLAGAWMESDAFVYSASEADWWKMALKRLLVLSVLSVMASGVVWLVNKPLFSWGGFNNQRLPSITAGVTVVSLCIAGLVGTITFAVTKPYM